MADRHSIVATAMTSDAHYQDETPCRRVKLFIESPDEKISHVATENSPLTSPNTDNIVMTQDVPNGQASPFDLEFGAEIGGMLAMSDDQGTQVSDCIEKVVCGNNSPKDDTPARRHLEQSARKKVCYDVLSTPPDASPLIFFESHPMETEESMTENSQDLFIEIDSDPASSKKTNESTTDIGIECQSASVAVKSTIATNDEWSIAHDKMKFMGWRHATGSGLVNHYFLPPGGKLQRQGGRLDEDYVEDIFGMQKYAYKHLGWGGDEDFLRDLKELESTRPAEGGRSKRRQNIFSVELQNAQRLVKPRSDRKRAAEARIETQANGSAFESENEAAQSIPENETTKRPAKRAATTTSTQEPQSTQRSVRPRSGQKSAAEARVKIQGSRSVNESHKGVPQSSPEIVTTQRPAQRAATIASNLVLQKAKITQVRAGHPDRMKTVGEKLKACQRALDTQFSLGTLSGVAGVGVAPEHQSLFQRNVGSLSAFLRAVVETKGARGEKLGDPASLYICGAPGVGKTSAVQWACKETELWASEKQGLDNLLLPSFCFINADDMQTTSNALKKITEIIADALSLKGKRRTREGVEKALEGGPRSHSCLVMVVDEIDLLLSERSKRSDVPSSSSETALKMLCELSTAQNFRFALIGISNAVGNQHVKRLQRFGLVSGQKLALKPSNSRTSLTALFL
jgi:Cdc6-like AAA superfamily ATPase